MQLALKLYEKGEFYKFVEIFGNGRIDDENVL
nr:MAG TPA: Pulmonary surfactant-associated protein D surfactant protein, trimer, ambiguous [Bacteriophage sp.]